MKKSRHRKNVHCATVAACAALVGSAGIAAETSEPDALQEVLVTATRRVDSANRVPITISAVTQDALDQQGIKTAADLTRIVPSLNAVANPGGGQETFSIRGIVGSTGAATTSVYLDDVNLTKRANGGVAQNNGVLTPILYDLARVEVLKGPQGTLFGGSSEGGTIRFITPTPSLTEYSGTGRAEFSTMGGRSASSYEAGGAVGGPIIADKLAFRVSAVKQEYGGWIDEYSAYTGNLIKKNDNTSIDWAGRAALLWKISESSNLQLSAYHVENKYEGGPGTTTAIFVGGALAPPGQTFTTLGRCITNNTRTAPLAQANGAPAASFIPTNVACTSAAAVPGTVYFRPGATYGPFPQGQDIALATGIQNIDPATAQSDVASATLNFDLPQMNIKLISSYLTDKGHSDTTGGEEFSSTTTGAGQFTTADPAHRGFPLFAPFYAATGLGNSGLFDAKNKRAGVEEEARFASVGDQRFNWVAGVYFSNATTEVGYNYLSSVTTDDLVMQEMYGPTFAGPAGNTSASAARYGLANTGGYQAQLAASIQDREVAAFTEWNVWLIPDRLKAILGARYSGVELNYYQVNYGQFSGRLPSSIGSVTQGHSTDSPFTPKYGLEYQINNQNMIYATASRGFRAGGVNAQISQTICETALDQIGITASDVPAAYKPDTVWSYELGGKFRLFDQLQLNLSAYRIDWNGIQATTTLSCGQGFTSNGGRAESKGAEAQLVYQPLHQLSFYLNAGYTDAFYVDAVKGPVPTLPGVSPTPSLNAGDKFNIPPIQASTGSEVNVPIGPHFNGFFRLDYTYQNAYSSGATFGTSGYGANYFTGRSPSQDQFNLRIGARWDNGLDVNLFVLNVLDREKKLAGFSDGRGSCLASSVNCASYVAYSPFVTQQFQTPRRIGVQMNYKF